MNNRMYGADKNDSFGLYGSPITLIDVVYVWVSHILIMPEIIGLTRLIINGLIAKTIIKCYYQLLPINNNYGPVINFLIGIKLLLIFRCHKGKLMYVINIWCHPEVNQAYPMGAFIKFIFGVTFF